MTQEERKKLVSEILAGIAFGVFLCALILIGIRTNDYHLGIGAYILMIVVATGLPMCTAFLDTVGLSRRNVVMIMLVVSLVLSSAFALMTAVNSTGRWMLMKPILVVHFLSAGINGIYLFVRKG